MAGDKQIIVGDIGGTNGRFAVATVSPEGDVRSLNQRRQYFSADYSSLAEMLKAYLGDLGCERPGEAHLAIAGPTSARQGHLTNLGWEVSASALEHSHGFRTVKLLNDFHALAAAAPGLSKQETLAIKSGERGDGGPISVMGPGTGFGVSLVIPIEGGHHVVSTEGGHMVFSPVSDLELELTEYLRQHCAHVSLETLFCGSGLARIYGFFAAKGGRIDTCRAPADITSSAMDGSDPLSVESVRLFVSMLASAAGDIALVHGATGGVVLGGGILPRIKPFLSDSDFEERFVAKGPMQGYLEKISVDLITCQNATLVGTARVAKNP